MSTAAKGAIDTSVEMRMKTGKLNVSGLSNQEIKDEISKYKKTFDDIHRIVLRQAKKHAKRVLASNEVDMDDDSDEPSPPIKRVKT